VVDEVSDTASPPGPSIGARAVGNSAMLLVARVLSQLLALFTVFATANVLGTTGNGYFTTSVTLGAVASILIDLGFSTLYQREAARHPDQLPHYLRAVLSTRTVFAVPALVALAIAMDLAYPGGKLLPLLVPAFVNMLLSTYANVLRGTFYALGRLGYEAFAIVGWSLLLLVATALGILTHQGVAYFLWAYAASWGLTCVYYATIIAGRGIARFGWEFELDFLRPWFRRSLPFALAFVVTTLYFKSNVIILGLIRNASEVGIYAFATKPMEALLFVPTTIMNVAFPVLSIYHKEAPEKMLGATSRFYKALLAVGWPITIGTALLAPGINGLLDRSPHHPFAPAAAALQILALGIFVMFVTNAFIATLNAMDRQVLFTWATVISLVANLALNLALIPRFGFLGAAWATVLTEVALLATGWLMVRRILGPVRLLRLSWRIGLAGLVMGAAIFPFQSVHGPAVLAVVLLGAAVYAGGVLVVRAFDSEELALARRSLRLRR
jgi:O-antigen/teichoic acid export membrane protein